MVYVRGPAEPDCGFETNRAKARNDAAALFLAEFKCKLQAGWKCAATCSADELLVMHVAVRVGADGKPPNRRSCRRVTTPGSSSSV
jgi:hypothetical protein